MTDAVINAAGVADGEVPLVETVVEEPPRRGRTRRARIIALIAAICALALVATGFLFWRNLRQALPQTSGQLTLPGLSAPVQVARDEQGVPRIYADTAEDLFRAQGFVDAQDRFFQMDYRRHVANGQLAELMGDADGALDSDKVARTLGWRRVAEAEWDLLDQRTRDYLQAYADGVNAYLSGRSLAQISLEYVELQRTLDISAPAEWTPIDSLAWLKAMAWNLRSNYFEELDRAVAYTAMQSVDRVNELFPPYADGNNPPILAAGDLVSAPYVPPEAPVVETPEEVAEDDTPVAGEQDEQTATPTPNPTPEAPTEAPVTPADTAETATPTSPTAAGRNPLLADDSVVAALAATRQAIAATPLLLGDAGATGSNAWVVSGDYTASGRPMLANDPHLLLTVPGVWSQVGLHCNTVSEACPFNVEGFSFAGHPGVWIGHNGQLAWGLANLTADTTDFFIERVHEAEALRGGVWEPMQVRTETINVAGGAPVDLVVRTTAHGPIVSDVLDVQRVTGAPTNSTTHVGIYAVSLAWSGLEPGRTSEGILALNVATNADDVQAAAAKFTVPTQAIVFATADGDIGFQAAGLVPERNVVLNVPVPSDGTWPQDGQNPQHDWQGWIPAEQMPRALNPERGYIVAANQAVTDSGVGPYLGFDWDYGFRARRIGQLLRLRMQAGIPFTSADFTAIQLDDWTPIDEILRPWLLTIELPNEYSATGQNEIRDWDGYMGVDSVQGAYLMATWRHLLRDTFWDELPQSIRAKETSRWAVVMRNMLEEPDDPFWDDRATLNITESRGEVLRNVLISARDEMTTRISKNPVDWAWGKLHYLRLQNEVLGNPTRNIVLRHFANLPDVPLPGSSLTVNANAWDAGAGTFEVTTGPTMRMVVDMGNLDASTWQNLTGTSGHVFSPHYRDQFENWVAGEPFRWVFSRNLADAAAEDALTLVP